MNKWERSVGFTLKWEGGYVCHPQDKGGATNMGITHTTLRRAYEQGIAAHSDVRQLTKDEAMVIYRRNFWDKYDWEKLPWPVCLCCFEISVNHGGFAFILQRACCELGANLAIDGKYGPKTRMAVYSAAIFGPIDLARQIAAQRRAYYERIIKKSPSQEIFRRGWMNRLNDMRRVCGIL